MSDQGQPKKKEARDNELVRPLQFFLTQSILLLVENGFLLIWTEGHHRFHTYLSTLPPCFVKECASVLGTLFVLVGFLITAAFIIAHLTITLWCSLSRIREEWRSHRRN
jgi:hypothetical protein